MNIPTQHSSYNNIPGFLATLPDVMWCTEHCDYGVIVRKKHNAIKKRYITFNSPNNKGWIVLDIDHENARMFWQIYDLPAPNLIIENPKNTHAHYAYLLETPVHFNENSSKKAISFYLDLVHKLQVLCHADHRFAHFVSKNPLHSEWKTTIVRPLDNPYSLNELNENLPRELDKDEKRVKGLKKQGEGRNCALFDTVRFEAYPMVKKFKNNLLKESDFRSWCQSRCEHYNQEFFPNNLLPKNEIISISKSISKFCWISTRGNITNEEFSELQRSRIRKRWGVGISERATEPWKQIINPRTGKCISRKTYYQWKAQGKLPVTTVTPQTPLVGKRGTTLMVWSPSSNHPPVKQELNCQDQAHMIETGNTTGGEDENNEDECPNGTQSKHGLCWNIGSVQQSEHQGHLSGNRSPGDSS